MPQTTTQQPYESGDYGFSDVYGDGEGDVGDVGGVGGVGDVEFDGEHEGYGYDNNAGHSQIDMASNAVSQCPVENGVIRTPWGAVAAGPLIAGTFYSTHYFIRIQFQFFSLHCFYIPIYN